MCLQFQGLQAFDLGAIALRCQSLTEPSAYKEIPWGGEKGRQLPSSPHWTESPSFNPIMPVLVSDCCCNKLLQWFKPYKCIVLQCGGQSLKWAGRAVLSLEAAGGNLSLAPLSCQSPPTFFVHGPLSPFKVCSTASSNLFLPVVRLLSCRSLCL